MGKRGLPRTPTAILKARGSWLAKESDRADEPSLPVASHRCPALIADDEWARDYWREVFVPLFRFGVISVSDVNSAIRACQAWSRLQRATKVVLEEGVTLATEKGEVAHPALATINGANDILNRLEPQFGIMPANRSRITNAVTKRPAEDTQDKSRFFKAV